MISGLAVEEKGVAGTTMCCHSYITDSSFLPGPPRKSRL